MTYASKDSCVVVLTLGSMLEHGVQQQVETTHIVYLKYVNIVLEDLLINFY